MNEQEFEELARGLFRGDLDEIDLEDVARVTTFEERGVLTMDRGLVVQMMGGEEFFLTIRRSR